MESELSKDRQGFNGLHGPAQVRFADQPFSNPTANHYAAIEDLFGNSLDPAGVPSLDPNIFSASFHCVHLTLYHYLRCHEAVILSPCSMLQEYFELAFQLSSIGTRGDANLGWPSDRMALALRTSEKARPQEAMQDVVTVHNYQNNPLRACILHSEKYMHKCGQPMDSSM